jgi:hypothetical protein
MGPIEELYRDFCERIAHECELEAERYEKNPKLQDKDRQFVYVLRERAKRLHHESRRLEAEYKRRAG